MADKPKNSEPIDAEFEEVSPEQLKREQEAREKAAAEAKAKAAEKAPEKPAEKPAEKPPEADAKKEQPEAKDAPAQKKQRVIEPDSKSAQWAKGRTGGVVKFFQGLDAEDPEKAEKLLADHFKRMNHLVQREKSPTESRPGYKYINLHVDSGIPGIGDGKIRLEAYETKNGVHEQISAKGCMSRFGAIKKSHAEAMMAAAAAKGWTNIEINSKNAASRKKMWEAAQKYGLTVTNYVPPGMKAEQKSTIKNKPDATGPNKGDAPETPQGTPPQPADLHAVEIPDAVVKKGGIHGDLDALKASNRPQIAHTPLAIEGPKNDQPKSGGSGPKRIAP